MEKSFFQLNPRLEGSTKADASSATSTSNVSTMNVLPFQRLLLEFPWKSETKFRNVDGVEFDYSQDDNTDKMVKMHQLIGQTHEWTFPIFELEGLAQGRPLIFLCTFLFQKYNLFDFYKIKIEKFYNFMNSIEAGYHADLPYHNSTHASDVLHAVSYLITYTNASAGFTDLDLLSLFISAAIHDFDHPGFTNNFLVTTGDEKAILYNDKSVLENHHISFAFKTLNLPQNNFISHFSKVDYKAFRENVVNNVLATDLIQHFEIVNLFKGKVRE
jgi:hypothetical protein